MSSNSEWTAAILCFQVLCFVWHDYTISAEWHHGAELYLRSWQSVRKFPSFYGTQRFTTVYTTVRHWSLSWATCIQSTISQPISLTSSNIFFLSTPRISEWSFPFRFHDQNIVCIYLFRACYMPHPSYPQFLCYSHLKHSLKQHTPVWNILEFFCAFFKITSILQVLPLRHYCSHMSAFAGWKLDSNAAECQTL